MSENRCRYCLQPLASLDESAAHQQMGRCHGHSTAWLALADVLLRHGLVWRQRREALNLPQDLLLGVVWRHEIDLMWEHGRVAA